MGTMYRVVKNSIALVSVTILERGIGFLLPWYIARTLGKGPMGEYSTAISWIFVTLPLAIWGFDQLLLREISRDREALSRYLVNASLVVVGSVTVTAVLLGLIINLFDYPPSLDRLLWVSALFVLPLYTGSLLLETAIKSLERMEWIVGIRTPLTLVRVGGSIYLLFHGVQLEVVFLLLGVYYAATCLIYYFVIRFFVPNIKRTFDPLAVRQLAIHAIPFVLIGVFGITFKQVDRIVLSALRSMEEIGIYSAGATVMAMVLLIAPAMMESLFPGLSRMHVSAPQHLPEMVARLLRLVWFISVPIMLTTITIVRPAILLLFTTEYSASILIAQILALAIVPAFLSRLLYRIILASNNERTTLRIAAINSVIGVGLNLLLIPSMGLVGASIATISAECAGFLQNLYFVHNRVVKISLWQTMGKPFLSAMSAAATYWWIRQWNEYIALIVALSLYIGVAVYLSVISKTDFFDIETC